MQTHSEIHTGMTVRSRDGEKLGTIVGCQDEGFTIERGLFFPKDYAARYDYVEDVRGSEVYLSLNKDDLVSGRAAPGAASTGMSEGVAGFAQPAPEAIQPPASEMASTEGTARIPLAEERVQAEKTIREAGEVRVSKEVVTEQKQITVPVTHEEVRVEHIPADQARAASPSEAAFTKEEMRIPIHQEEVRVTKTPVVTEELKVSKQEVTEQKTVSAEARKEVAKVDKEGQIRERDVPPSTPLKP